MHNRNHAMESQKQKKSNLYNFCDRSFLHMKNPSDFEAHTPYVCECVCMCVHVCVCVCVCVHMHVGVSRRAGI